MKGTFVCAYVGERVSEEDLQRQEEIKIAGLKAINECSLPTSQSMTSPQVVSTDDMMKGYVTYAFQIHDGTDIVNIDSE